MSQEQLDLFDYTLIPGALPESAYNAIGNVTSVEVSVVNGTMADGSPWPEFQGSKWPWMYDIMTDSIRLVSQKDLAQLTVGATAYGTLKRDIEGVLAVARSNLLGKMAEIDEEHADGLS